MDILMLIGRIVFAYIFVEAGLNHLARNKPYIEYATAQKVPNPRASTYLSGLVLLLCGLSIILGVYVDVGALAIAVLLLVMGFKMHNYWTSANTTDKGAFWKNVSMAGAALFMFATVANDGDFGPVLRDNLLQLWSK